MEKWESLLQSAIDLLESSGLNSSQWTFGGGTVLKFKYHHRNSDDIDIFFNDPQLLSFTSPSINDELGDFNSYKEDLIFNRFENANGKVDFIASPPITDIKPHQAYFGEKVIYLDDPLEIVAKKIFYREDSFKERDMFDMAVVYYNDKHKFLSLSNKLELKINVLQSRMEKIANRVNPFVARECLFEDDLKKFYMENTVALCFECLNLMRNRAHSIESGPSLDDTSHLSR